MTLEDAIAKVENWVGPFGANGSEPPAPDFSMRCAIRRVIKGAKEGREELNRIRLETGKSLGKVEAE